MIMPASHPAISPTMIQAMIPMRSSSPALRPLSRAPQAGTSGVLQFARRANTVPTRPRGTAKGRPTCPYRWARCCLPHRAALSSGERPFDGREQVVPVEGLSEIGVRSDALRNLVGIIASTHHHDVYGGCDGAAGTPGERKAPHPP